VAVLEDLGIRLRKVRGATQGPLSPHSYFAENESARPGRLPLVPLAVAAAVAIAGIVYVALLVVSLAQAQRLTGAIH
jgi:hypothetical protein